MQRCAFFQCFLVEENLPNIIGQNYSYLTGLGGIRRTAHNANSTSSIYGSPDPMSPGITQSVYLIITKMAHLFLHLFGVVRTLLKEGSLNLAA